METKEVILIKNNLKAYDKEILFKACDFDDYYYFMVKVSSAYMESLYYFSRAEFHKNKLSQRLDKAAFIRCLVFIYKNLAHKELVLKKIGKNSLLIKKLSERNFEHQLLRCALGQQKAAFRFYYKGHYDFEEKLTKIYDKRYIENKNEDMRRALILLSQSSHLKDRYDYYLTYTDTEILECFVWPVLSFHAILIALAFLPAALPVLGILKSTGISTGMGLVKTHALQVIKKFYNLFLRSQSFYSFDQKMLDKALQEAQRHLDLEKLKGVILMLRQSASKIGETNYFIANSVKYYSILKSQCDNLCADYVSSKNLFSDHARKEDYEEKISNIKKSYLKLMFFFKNKTVLEKTTYVTIDSLKMITSQSLILFRGNPDFNEFLKKYKRRYSDTEIKSKVVKMMLELGAGPECLKFTDFIMLTLNTEALDESLKQIHIVPTFHPEESLGKSCLNFTRNIGNTGDFVTKMTKILEYLPGTKFYILKMLENYRAFDFGLWLTLNALDGILYLKNDVSLSEKYRKISLFLKKISSLSTVGTYGIGAINLVGAQWCHFFSSLLLPDFSINPFYFLLPLASITATRLVSKNYYSDSANVFDNFKEYKKKYSSLQYTPCYDYFFCEKKMFPGEAVHKISDLYKEMMIAIIENSKNSIEKSLSLIKKINDLKNLVENKEKNIQRIKAVCQLGKNAFPPGPAYFSEAEVRNAEDSILKEYIHILCALFAQSKDLELYGQYLNFTEEFHSEIKNFLGLNFALLHFEDKELFSMLNFAKDPGVNAKIFL
jgi:hypothetical protein